MHSNWALISARTSMTVEELERMQNLADQINQAIGVRATRYSGLLGGYKPTPIAHASSTVSRAPSKMTATTIWISLAQCSASLPAGSS